MRTNFFINSFTELQNEVKGVQLNQDFMNVLAPEIW